VEDAAVAMELVKVALSGKSKTIEEQGESMLQRLCRNGKSCCLIEENTKLTRYSPSVRQKGNQCKILSSSSPDETEQLLLSLISDSNSKLPDFVYAQITDLTKRTDKTEPQGKGKGKEVDEEQEVTTANGQPTQRKDNTNNKQDTEGKGKEVDEEKETKEKKEIQTKETKNKDKDDNNTKTTNNANNTNTNNTNNETELLVKQVNEKIKRIYEALPKNCMLVVMCDNSNEKQQVLDLLKDKDFENEDYKQTLQDTVITVRSGVCFVGVKQH